MLDFADDTVCILFFLYLCICNWQNTNKGAQSKVDYLTVVGGEIIPIKAKASTRGSMQSLYQFMQKHHSAYGVRTSMENISVYRNGDYEVHTIPLYALSYVGDMK